MAAVSPQQQHNASKFGLSHYRTRVVIISHPVLRCMYSILAALTLLIALPRILHTQLFDLSGANPGHTVALDGVLSEALKNSNSIGPQWITANPSLPYPVARHAAVMVKTGADETLCTIGGDTKQAYCYPLESSRTPNTGAGSTYALADDLRFHAAIAVNNLTYVLGGYVTPTNDLKQDVTCVKHEVNNSWTVNPPSQMKYAVMQHAAVVVDNRLYVIGGFGYSGSSPTTPNYLADVWSAAVGPTSCTVLNKASWTIETPLPGARTGHAAVAVEWDQDHKYIYIIGGLLANGTLTNTVLRTKVAANGSLGSTWDNLGAVKNMPINWLLTAAVSGRYLYVFGGSTSVTATNSLDAVHRALIQPNGGLTWDDALPDLPVPLRSHATAVSKSGNLYVLGGIADTELQDKVYFARVLNFVKENEPAQGPVAYGKTVTYTLTLNSLGVRDFMTLTVTDTVKTDASAIFHSTGPCSAPAGNTITCTIPSLALAETKVLTFQVTITDPAFYSPATEVVGAPIVQESDANPDLNLQINNTQPLVIAGKELTYTLVVSNIGMSTAQDVVLRDVLPDGVTFESATPPPSDLAPLTWSWDDIPAGKGKEIQLRVRVAPSSTGLLNNTAVVSSNQLDPSPTNNHAHAWVNAVGQTDLRISTLGYADPKITGTLIYTITVYNSGPSDARGVVVTNTLPENASLRGAIPPQRSGPSPLIWNLDIPVGQSRDIQIVADAEPGNSDMYCNTARLSSNVDTSFFDNVAQRCAPTGHFADLMITKTDTPDPVKVSETVTYTLVVTNAGPSRARNVVVRDLLPASALLIDTIPNADGSTPSIVEWHVPALRQGESREFKIVMQVNSDSTGVLLNVARVSSDLPDNVPDNNQAFELTAINDKADLGLEKRHSDGLVVAGNLLTYTFVVSNAGPSIASDVVVIDKLPAGTRFVTSTSPVSVTDRVVTWTIPTLLSGQRGELALVAQVDSSVSGYLLNTATVASTMPDSNPRNNTGVDLAIVYTQADIDIEKHSSARQVSGGDRLTYTLQITNQGPSDARSVEITDTLPAGVTFLFSAPPLTSRLGTLTWSTDTLAANTVWTITVVATVNSSASGKLANMACANSIVDDNHPMNNCSAEQIQAPVSVINTAYICEERIWCLTSNTVSNVPVSIYLPIVRKSGQ